MEHQIELDRFANPRPIAVVRRRAGAAERGRVVQESCGIVWNALKAAKVTGAGRHVSVHGADNAMEIGAEIPAPFGGAGEVVDSALPAGVVARTVHLGPYGGLGGAHEAVRAWCRNNGLALAGPFWEIYGHWLPEWDRDPSQIQTDVCYLVTGPGPEAMADKAKGG